MSDLLTNQIFWSALFGLLGTILIFFFGLPPRIDPDGHSYLLLESDDEDEKKKAKRYKITSYLGLFFIALSFLLQLLNIIMIQK